MSSSPAGQGRARVTFIGHSTVAIEAGGTLLLTDPVLRDRVGFLRRSAGPKAGAVPRPDAVLISHLHHDHFDRPTLRRLGREVKLIVPNGARGFARGIGFEDVLELRPGEATAVGRLEVAATRAAHRGRRSPWGARAESVGYVISGAARIYFAGDTGLFAEMGELAPDLDLALLPVWGWGTSVGEGHLDPERAARALALLRPRVAVPIHWGTLHPIGFRRRMASNLTEPPREFARLAAEHAPGVEVRILAPGESLTLDA